MSRYLSYCLKKKLVPIEVRVLFGALEPSWGHAKRVCKLMKSESWRQVRFYFDWLKVVLQEECGCDTGQQQFAKHKRKANQLAEFLWQNVRSTFTSKPRLAATGSSVTYLGDVRIPETVEQVLKKGPKYSFQPRSTRPEMLSHVHRFGQRVQEQDQQRAIGDGIDCLVKTVSDQRVPRPPLKFVVKALKERNLMVLTSDKEGGFVVLPERMYEDKALDAVCKNFKEVHFCPKKRKTMIQKMLKEMNLDALCREVVKTSNVTLQSFFTCKTHKCDYPLRLIVSEKGSWQRVVSRYLQSVLGSLNSGDPFLVRSSLEIVSTLKESLPVASTAFSIDVEELFYSIPHGALFDAVRSAIEEFGEISFQNKHGIFVNNFLELLKFYLESTAIGHQEGTYVQKAGICIGSAVAPVLSDIFLAAFDQRLKDDLSHLDVVRTFRYVDDYLIVLGKVPCERVQGVVKGVLEVFNRHSSGLKFTHEMPVDNEIQFLDLRLKFAKEHICFKYNPRSKKGLLPFDSAHSKLIKRGIVLSAFAEALDKSCPHLISESFEDQATGVSVENLKDTFHNTLYPFTWDLPKHDKVVVHIPEGANDIQMGQIILQALVEGCQENVTKNRCDCRSNTNSSFLDVGAFLVADCSGL
ncbi:uncharacterized protein LOC142791224 [Rhipicephalus microplus]|uniref:uncharacterized protein LOC142791224 n=1 Tax=Rhipicephalus microplus TaxID=6941 RepID=UPI003F6AE16C